MKLSQYTLLDSQSKQNKIAAARVFLEHVRAGRASISEYVAFGNLHEDEIQEKIFQIVNSCKFTNSYYNLGFWDETISGSLENFFKTLNNKDILIKEYDGNIFLPDNS